MGDSPPPSGVWTPVALGALDVRSDDTAPGGPEVLLAPVVPGDAFCLVGDGAALWRHLVAQGSVRHADLSADERELIARMRDLHIVDPDPRHPWAVTHLPRPALSSPTHELVYAVTARVAETHGIRCVFIKGPALKSQGLREREHSGDVDVWCDPDRWDDLAAALEPWGWTREPDPWRGTPVHHTATMTPARWGCEIDVHRRLPGLTRDDRDAFAALIARTSAVRYAGVEVRVPDVAAHAVLAAVHAVRPEIGAGPRSDRASALATTMLAAAPTTLDSAVALGAVEVLRTEIAAATRTAPPPTDGTRPNDWEWRGRPDRLRAYWTALQTLPPLLRLRVGLRLIWPDDDVALASERRAVRPVTTAAAARRSRLTRGAREWLARSSRR